MNPRIAILSVAMTLMLASPAVRSGAYDDMLQAAYRSDTGQVVDLLRRGMDVNTVDKEGQTLLMIAVRNDNLELARFLIANGANPDRKNPYGDTALMLAALAGQREMTALILQGKPSLNHSGWNALHYAAYAGHAEIASLLVAAGANVNWKAPNQQTPLMFAAKNGHYETVRFLVGAQADTAQSDPVEGSARDMAQKAGHTQIVGFLVKLGAP